MSAAARRTRLALCCLALGAALLDLPGDAGSQPAPPIVAAASDLQFALETIADRFAKVTGEQVKFVYASSGTLARQIHGGAPFELFLSADEAFVEELADAGLTRDRGVVYAIGRLVLFAPHGSSLEVDEKLAGVRQWLDSGAPGRFAIANPEHAPYGRAARAALRSAGLWERIEPRLVLGESVAQTARFAVTGDAVGGILAHSLVTGSPMARSGRFVLLPETLHPPLRQRMVLLKRATPTAVRFYEFLQQPQARAVLREYGFELPDN